MTEFQTTLQDHGSFHEEEIVAIESNDEQIVIRILNKTCADQEEDREVLQKTTLSFSKIVERTFSDRSGQVGWDEIANATSIDLSIVFLESEQLVGLERVKVFVEGFLDDRFFESAVITIAAKSANVVIQNNSRT